MSGDVVEAELHYIIRDHDRTLFEEKRHASAPPWKRSTAATVRAPPKPTSPIPTTTCAKRSSRTATCSTAQRRLPRLRRSAAYRSDPRRHGRRGAHMDGSSPARTFRPAATTTMAYTNSFRGQSRGHARRAAGDHRQLCGKRLIPGGNHVQNIDPHRQDSGGAPARGAAHQRGALAVLGGAAGGCARSGADGAPDRGADANAHTMPTPRSLQQRRPQHRRPPRADPDQYTISMVATARCELSAGALLRKLL